MPIVVNEIPAHVPPELAVEIPFVRGATTLTVPHDVLNDLSAGPPIFFAPQWPTPAGSWVVRQAQIWREIALKTEHVTTAGFTPFAKMAGGSWKMIPIEIDPPQHNKYRLVLNPRLSPKAISAIDARIAAYAREAVDAFKNLGRCEFMSEFAYEFPIRIFVELMGWPAADTPRLLKMEHGLLNPKSADEMQASVLAIVDYLTEQIDMRRGVGGDDFIAHILEAEIDGRKLDEDELMGVFFTLFVGGLDTVSVHLAFAVRHLAEHAQDQAFLRANPDQIPAAVEEFMRFYGTAGSMRTCTRDLDVAGVSIKAGDKLMALPLLAGRDALGGEDPFTIRFDRTPQHIGFGYGPHVCIGMHLARREMRVALATLLEVLPPFQLDPQEPVVSEMSGMLQPRNLPLVWSRD